MVRLPSSSALLFASSIAPHTLAEDSGPDLRHLGGLGPYTSHESMGIDSGTPDGCKVDQVIMYSRHGERYPDTGDYDRMNKIVDKLKEDDGLSGPLEFIKDYNFFMEKDKSGILTENGRYAGETELKNLGKSYNEKYGDLIGDIDKLNIFATDMDRVYKSANHFAEGFFGTDWESKANVLQLKESGDPMNSLTPEVNCRDQFTGEHKPNNEYKEKEFKSIADRLKEYTSVDLSISDVESLMLMCPFELNAKGESDFCGIFESDEWKKFEYSRDLNMYYDYPVYKAGIAAGAVLTNASKTLMKDGPENVGGLFFEFTHDAVLTEIYTALNIFMPDEKLPGDKEPDNNPFQISQISPMLGHVTLERLSCDGHDEPYVRINVNDAYVPFHDCTSGPGQSCPLDEYEDILDERFVSYQDLCGMQDGYTYYTDVFWKNKNV
jgi:acid phosphatase